MKSEKRKLIEKTEKEFQEELNETDPNKEFREALKTFAEACIKELKLVEIIMWIEKQLDKIFIKKK